MKRVGLIGLILLLSPLVFSSEDLIVPEICVDRAHTIGIFDNSKDLSTTRQKLTISKAPWQVYNFKKLYEAYEETLSTVATQVENYQSPLFTYLQHCRLNEKTCHGYFKPDNSFHVQIYCDREILRSSIESIMGIKDARFDKCINQPFDEITIDEALELNSVYDKNCFETIDKDGQIYLKNKSHTYSQELRWVDGWRSKMINATLATIRKSMIPEGIAFIIQKSIEEFKDLNLREAKINDLNIFYRTRELIHEFQTCCENVSANLPDGQLSLSYLEGTSTNIQQSMSKPSALVFSTQDYLSELAFQEAERQYWKDLFTTKSPLELSETQKLLYFQFLKQDHLFYFEYERTFQDLVAETKEKKRSEFSPKVLTLEEQKAYEQKMGYKYETPRSYKLQDKIIPKEHRLMFDYNNLLLNFDKNKVEGNFLFNPDFQDLYMDQLEENQANKVYEKFENQKKIYYPRIFKSFLPYQFARTAQAKIIRALQKQKKSTMSYILNDAQAFQHWAESITCSGFEDSFCSQDTKIFREKKYLDLYEKIITEVIPIEYAPENSSNSSRKFIYSHFFLNDINQQILSINKFCWDVADQKGFKENPKSFAEKTQKLDEKIQNFYSTTRFEELLGQNEFFKLLEFDPDNYHNKCFTKGYLFGDSGYYSALGHQLTSQVSGYAAGGAIPVYSHVDLSTYDIRKVYIPSIYKLTKEDLEDVEKDIEEKIQEEFQTLREVYRYNTFEEYKEFLEESSTVRLLAMIDFALDNPSSEIGKYLCNLIEESDADEYSAIKRRQMITNTALIAATVATVFVLPGAAAGISVLYEAGTAITFSAIAIGSASYNIKYYNNKNDLTDMSVLTRNIMPIDAISLHQLYNEHISNEKTSIAINLGLMIVIGARPIFQSTKYIQKLLDKEYQLARKSRQLRIEEFVRRSPQESGFYITQRMEDFLFDYKKVSNQQFDDFFKAFKRGEAEGHIMANWESQLGRYLPIKRLEPRTWKESLNSLATSIRQKPGIKKPYEWLAEKNSIFLQPSWYRAKPYFNQYFLNYFNNSLRNEARMVKMLENAKELSKKTGKNIFTEDEIASYASKMKHFKLAKDGTFQKIANKSFEKVLDRFMLRSVTGENHIIRKYLEPLIEGELLKKEEWELVLKAFNKQIRSIDDAKTFLKTIKYAKKEYSSLWDQMKNAPELLNGREFLKPAIYEKRFNIIVSHIDEFYDIAQYTRFRNNVRMVEDFKSMMQSTGKTLDEIESEIIKKYPEFSLKKTFENYEREKAQVLFFDEAAALQSNPNSVRQVTRELVKDESALVTSYKKQFLQQEKEFNEYFHQHLIKGFQKQLDAGAAYQRALVRTQIRKSTEYECSLPDSLVRKEANRTYQRLAGKISLGTNFMGYMTVHGDEEKDEEWITRMTYEMAISYFGGQVQARIFTRKGGGPLYKTTHDLLSGTVITALDGATYWATNENLWDKKSKFELEFAKMINETNNIKQTVHQYFSEHPEIEQKILQEFQKVHDVFDELELKNSKGTMVDSDMEDAFIRAGLIDNVLYSDMELKNRELGKDYIYHDLIESGYLDKDLYRKSETNEEFEHQLFDIMADMMYQDLYDHKSGELKYPMLDPIAFADGDIDSMEIQSGSETLDRMIFYTSYDIAKTPFAYAKSNLVYRILCNGRFLPGNMNIALAVGTHLVYKSIMDPLKWYAREQATGR